MEVKQGENFPVRPKIIFMGTPDFAVPSLKALIESGHNVLAVVTQPDRPRGRGRKLAHSPVKQMALRHGLDVLQPEKASERKFFEIVRGKGPDLLIVVAYGQILPGELLEIPRNGALNIHASLLPKYRGPAPIQWAILNDESKTGLTAMRMEEGLDTGSIVMQIEVPIFDDETAGRLHDRLATMSGDFLINTLEGLKTNRLRERTQEDSVATYAPKIDRRMSRVEWNKPVRVVSGLIRALDPWPGASTTVAGKEIKVFSSHVIYEKRADPLPGRVTGCVDDALEVETGDGVVLLGELQAPGRKRLPAVDFLRGFPIDRGTILGK